MSISCGPDLPAVEHTTSTRRHHKIIDDGRTLDRYPVEVLREWKAKREAEFDTATREALHGLGNLPTRLPDLLGRGVPRRDRQTAGDRRPPWRPPASSPTTPHSCCT